MPVYQILVASFLLLLFTAPWPCAEEQPTTTQQTLKNTKWILRKEYDPATQDYVDLPEADTIQFLEQGLRWNSVHIGAYTIAKDTLRIHLNGAVQPPFTIYPIDNAYHYHYQIDAENRLQLRPLDDREYDVLITVEGRELLLYPLSPMQ